MIRADDQVKPCDSEPEGRLVEARRAPTRSLFENLAATGCGFAIVLLLACGPPPDPKLEAQRFCERLEFVNEGNVDTRGLSEIGGHAKVAATLLEVAPAAIQSELEQFHGVFEGWAAAVTGERSMRDTFEALSDTSLVGAEGRIADYIAEACGIRIGDGSYVEVPRLRVQEVCPAWPRFISPLSSNVFPNLPDIAGGNYFANEFLITPLGVGVGNAFGVEPGGWVEIHGYYPETRYFAFHPNDMDLNNLPTLRDRDLDPDPGSVNPFREVPPLGSANTYTAKLVFGPPPENPEPNTRYVGVKKDGESTNRYVLNLLRYYATDPGDGANTGGFPLPAVTLYDSEGEVTHHFEECDLYANGTEGLISPLRFPMLPIADHRAANPPFWGTSSNFEAPSDTLANADVQYLSTVYSRRFGDIFVVRAKYLTAPDTRAGESHHGAGKDVRLYTFCTYNVWNGSAIDCMLENELAVDGEGYYTVVVSDAASRPGNLAAEAATWIDWGPYLDGQLSWRYVYRENPKVVAIARAIDGAVASGQRSPYAPVAVPCDRATFEAGGWRACFERAETGPDS